MWHLCMWPIIYRPVIVSAEPMVTWPNSYQMRYNHFLIPYQTLASFICQDRRTYNFKNMSARGRSYRPRPDGSPKLDDTHDEAKPADAFANWFSASMSGIFLQSYEMQRITSHSRIKKIISEKTIFFMNVG